MKKMIIILSIAILLITIIFSNFSYGENLGLGPLSEYRGKDVESSKVKEMAGNLLGAIQAVGVVVSVVMLTVIGIKYMLGSIEERAEYKKTLFPYIVGAFMVFAVTTIPQLIYTFMKNF